jgi:hypothetical protein
MQGSNQRDLGGVRACPDGRFQYVMKWSNNQIHSTAYAAIRNESLNANTFSSDCIANGSRKIGK